MVLNRVFLLIVVLLNQLCLSFGDFYVSNFDLKKIYGGVSTSVSFLVSEYPVAFVKSGIKTMRLRFTDMDTTDCVVDRVVKSIDSSNSNARITCIFPYDSFPTHRTSYMLQEFSITNNGHEEISAEFHSIIIDVVKFNELSVLAVSPQSITVRKGVAFQVDLKNNAPLDVSKQTAEMQDVKLDILRFQNGILTLAFTQDELPLYTTHSMRLIVYSTIDIDKKHPFIHAPLGFTSIHKPETELYISGVDSLIVTPTMTSFKVNGKFQADSVLAITLHDKEDGVMPGDVVITNVFADHIVVSNHAAFLEPTFSYCLVEGYEGRIAPIMIALPAAEYVLTPDACELGQDCIVSVSPAIDRRLPYQVISTDIKHNGVRLSVTDISMDDSVTVLFIKAFPADIQASLHFDYGTEYARTVTVMTTVTDHQLSLRKVSPEAITLNTPTPTQRLVIYATGLDYVGVEGTTLRSRSAAGTYENIVVSKGMDASGTPVMTAVWDDVRSCVHAYSCFGKQELVLGSKSTGVSFVVNNANANGQYHRLFFETKEKRIADFDLIKYIQRLPAASPNCAGSRFSVFKTDDSKFGSFIDMSIIDATDACVEDVLTKLKNSESDLALDIHTTGNYIGHHKQVYCEQIHQFREDCAHPDKDHYEKRFTPTPLPVKPDVPKKKKSSKTILVIIICVTILLFLIAAYFVYTKCCRKRQRRFDETLPANYISLN